MSFKEMKVGDTILSSKWVGLKNFIYVLTDDDIINVVKNTMEISLLKLIFGFIPPIALAVFFFDMLALRLKKLYQNIAYIPHFFSWVIVYGIAFGFFSNSGIVNSLIQYISGSKVDFLMSEQWFRTLLVGSFIWKEIGWGTILYLAALSGVNIELFEAAKLDGAGPISRNIHITVPAMLPIITFSLILTLGNILNSDFEQILMFYNPAVYNVGDIIDTWVYRVGLGRMQFGIGSAVGLMKALISFVLIFGSNALSRRLAGRGIW